MIEIIHPEVKNATKLPHVYEGLMRVFNTVKEAEPDQRIGYVAGMISSEGRDKIPLNMQKLRLYTQKVREKAEYPVFSAAELFDNGLHDSLEEFHYERELAQHHFVQFWRQILQSGHITDVHMAPRWEMSGGATDEHEVSQGENNIVLHYVEPDPEIENLTEEDMKKYG